MRRRPGSAPRTPPMPRIQPTPPSRARCARGRARGRGRRGRDRPRRSSRGDRGPSTPPPPAPTRSFEGPSRSPAGAAPSRGWCSRWDRASSPGCERGDRLELSSEVQVTVDCDKPSARCAGRPYDYDPHVHGLARAGGSQVASGALAGDRSAHPQLPPAAPKPPAPLPGGTSTAPPGSATTSRARSTAATRTSSSAPRAPLASGDQRMIIGANKPNGRIVQNKSRLNAIRLAPGETARRLVTERLRRGSLRLRPRRKVVLSQKVDGLERGDVLAVAAALRSDVRHLGYNALVGGELVVARGPRAADPEPPRAALGLAAGPDQPGQRHQLHARAVPVRDPQGRRRQGASRCPWRRRRAGGAIRQPRHPHEAEAGRPRARRPAAAAGRTARGSRATSRRARA